MLKRAVAMALAGAFAAAPAAAQDMTLEQVLEKHYEAIGASTTGRISSRSGRPG